MESCEASGMFLWACGTQQATHQIRDRFERSLDTISRKMAMVVDVMYGFAQTNILLFILGIFHVIFLLEIKK